MFRAAGAKRPPPLPPGHAPLRLMPAAPGAEARPLPRGGARRGGWRASPGRRHRGERQLVLPGPCSEPMAGPQLSRRDGDGDEDWQEVSGARSLPPAPSCLMSLPLSLSPPLHFLLDPSSRRPAAPSRPSVSTSPLLFLEAIPLPRFLSLHPPLLLSQFFPPSPRSSTRDVARVLAPLASREIIRSAWLSFPTQPRGFSARLRN